MDIYVGRQPIFDKKMNVFGYELLYRRSSNNFYEGLDDNQATAELINNTFLTMHFRELTTGTKAFINFSQDMLNEEIPLLLPKESVVVEILERVEISDRLIEACKKLRENGYIIALDDFVFNEAYLPLIEMAHIIKIEFPEVDHKVQQKLIKRYKHKIKFLAEKVETREEYKMAKDMGYDYFQGYFFSKPTIIKSKEIDSLNANLIRILEVLNEKEPDYQKVTEIIEKDLGLTYKLLKLSNSAIFGTTNKIYSIKHALVQLGIAELKKWVYVLLLKTIQVMENKELIKTCLVRAKTMELLATEIGMKDKKLECFLAGMFSSIDVLMNRSMKELTKELPLTADVKGALLKEDNDIKKMLDIVINYEVFKWNEIDINKINEGLTQTRFMEKYIEALTWVINLEY